MGRQLSAHVKELRGTVTHSRGRSVAEYVCCSTENFSVNSTLKLSKAVIKELKNKATGIRTSRACREAMRCQSIRGTSAHSAAQHSRDSLAPRQPARSRRPPRDGRPKAASEQEVLRAGAAARPASPGPASSAGRGSMAGLGPAALLLLLLPGLPAEHVPALLWSTGR